MRPDYTHLTFKNVSNSKWLSHGRQYTLTNTHTQYFTHHTLLPLLPSHSVIARDDEASSSPPLFPFSFPSPETLRWTVNSVEFQRGEGLMLLDEADWVNLSTWWTFCGLGSCSPADCRLRGWQRLFRYFSGVLKRREMFYCSVSGGGEWPAGLNLTRTEKFIIAKCIYNSLTGTWIQIHSGHKKTIIGFFG